MSRRAPFNQKKARCSRSNEVLLHIPFLIAYLIFWRLNMARSPKHKHKKRTPAQLNTMHCAIEAQWEFDIEDGSENSHRDGRIMELEVQLKDHKNKY